MNSSSDSISPGAGGFVPPNPGGMHPAAAGAAGPTATQPRPGRWA
ncbi:type VI secretion system protein TssL, partial [Burkholderia sp. Ac-20345]|nr:type VI secretion system protein TssL [Burkholderia sp. Ac-20345]